MPTIHLMVGFMGFGKTTVAKQLEQEFSAVRFTHDDIMMQLYGRNPDDFQTKYVKVDEFIKNETQKYVQQGQDVILDYGFWTHQKRQEYYNWAKSITDNVVFHVLECDIKEAKRRVLERSQKDNNALIIDEYAFDMFFEQYEPWNSDDKYPVIFHHVENDNIYTSAFNENVTKTHFGVYASIIKNGKILLIKKTQGPYTGLYDLPGGSLEKGETYIQALKREIKDETGVDTIKVTNKRFTSVVFEDFTSASGEQGLLQHNAVLYDVTVCNQSVKNVPDVQYSNGAIWLEIEALTTENSTPYALMAANKPLISIADESDKVVSSCLRGTPLKFGRFPMIASVLLFNSKGNLIMQKIAAHKRWGGLWTYSAAGHVDAGETYKMAAKRELKEEIGIDADIKREVANFPVIREGRQIAFHHVFEVHSDDIIVPDKQEVAEIREISLVDLQKEIKQNPEQFFDAFLTAIRIYIENMVYDKITQNF